MDSRLRDEQPQKSVGGGAILGGGGSPAVGGRRGAVMLRACHWLVRQI